jgi:hypothetical protein
LTLSATTNNRDLKSSDELIADLEADVLLECCGFGKIVKIVILEEFEPELIKLTPSTQTLDHTAISVTSTLRLIRGSIAVAFSRAIDAKTCAESLNSKPFRDAKRLLTTSLVDPAGNKASIDLMLSARQSFNEKYNIGSYGRDDDDNVDNDNDVRVIASSNTKLTDEVSGNSHYVIASSPVPIAQSSTVYSQTVEGNSNSNDNNNNEDDEVDNETDDFLNSLL